ncbi:NB-ARC domain-containing protein [Streptomyces sp. NPDC050617]|uniref:ATP-binding protein n=1 Tax=Streptomyces sp. NPDC050617 TaxID=3154628 RepID=UPI00343DC41A
MLNTLPNENTSFVGRTFELRELAEALGKPGLVTLTGGAGMGKSRLALRSARSGDWTGFSAVCWADLWPLQGSELLTAVVADALDLSDHTPRMPVDAVCDWIGDRRVLLVLDSCEHLVDACRSMVAELLAACPRLTVLATSREPLGTAKETLLELGPLPPGTAAVTFFEQRAAALGHPLRDGTTDRLLAERLCAHLEGVPLALELTVGLLRHWTLEQTWELAEQALDATDRPEMRPPWHRALRTAVGWSHELCRPAERLLWARLSVFPETFDAELAQMVCLGGPLTAEALRDALTGLVRKSVVTVDHGRYRMLDSVRAYGRMWLRELGEVRPVSARHATVMTETAHRANEEWLGPGQQYWYARIRDLYHDMCAALRFLLDERDAAALGLVADIAFFWVCSGHLHEVAHYGEIALREIPEPGTRRARGLWALGLTRILRGEHDQGRGFADESLAEDLGAGDDDVARQAVYLQGLAALLDGLPVQALNSADEATRGGAPAQRDGGEPDEGEQAGGPAFGIVLCRLVRVFALTGAGRLKEARCEAEALRELCVRLREYWTRSYVDYQLSLIALFEERPGEAGRHARDMLESKRRIGDQFGIAMGLDLLAASWSAQGDPECAVVAIGAGNQFWRAVGLLRRGTPEVLPLCEQTRTRTRELLGGAAYDERLRQAQSQSAEALLLAALAAHEAR